MQKLRFEQIRDSNKNFAIETINNLWYGTNMIVRGVIVDMTKASGIIAYDNDSPIGILTYIIDLGVCEILSVNSFIEHIGIGTKLLDELICIARKSNCSKLRLITTNDNIEAIKFYQKFGFDFTALYHNSIDYARKLKPTIPLEGEFGIAIKHELEFEYNL